MKLLEQLVNAEARYTSNCEQLFQNSNQLDGIVIIGSGAKSGADHGLNYITRWQPATYFGPIYLFIRADK